MLDNINKYVRIPPFHKNIFSWGLKTPFGIISIWSNKSICLERYIANENVIHCVPEKCIGEIIGLVDERLFSDLGISRYPESGGYILKEQVAYSEKLENIYYQIHNRQIIINHIPHRSIIDVSLENNKETLICPDGSTLHYLLPSAIKNVVSVLANKEGYLGLHCAAVEKNGFVYIIVGRGRSGKSTLYINLLEKGMNPLNDDLIFIHSDGTAINIKAIPLFAKFRLSSLPFVKSNIPFPEYDSSMTIEHEIYIDCENRYQVKNPMQGKIRAVIFPKINCLVNKIKTTTFNEKKKILFKEIITQQTTTVDTNLLNIYKCFKEIPFYEIELSEDIGKACNELLNILPN